MHPYLPFAAIPIAATAAWFAAANVSITDPGRYRVPAVVQIENPSVPAERPTGPATGSDIQVAVFLPHVPPSPPEPAPTLILHSVMTGSDVHLATINGQVVATGDQIEGYRVSRITPEGVELAKEGTTRHLPMRALHDLPPPQEPGVEPALQGSAAARNDPDALNRHFWSTFDSSQSAI